MKIKDHINSKLFIFLFVFAFAITGKSSNYIFEGYMDKISYEPGDTSKVYVSATGDYKGKTLFLLDVTGNVVDTVVVDLSPQTMVGVAPYTDGFGFSVSFKYTIPSNLKSGMYNWENKIFFIIKNPQKNADITLIYPSNTEAAYNNSGGKSLYDLINRPVSVSFQRPLSPWLLIEIKVLEDAFMEWFTMLNGYSVQVISDQDMDDYNEIQNSKIIVVVGHSEYWTRAARLNLDRFVDSGKDAVVLSGNTMGWQVRYNSDKTQLVCYKEVQDTISDPLLRTELWTDSILNYPVLKSIGVDWAHGAYPPSNTGSFEGWYGYKIMSPNSPLLAGTGLNFSDVLNCRSREYDGTLFSGFDTQNYPIVDTAALGFQKIELIGYDWAQTSLFALPHIKGYGTFVAFKKTCTSGNVINVAFTNWCSKDQPGGWAGGFGGPDVEKIKKISLNMFDLLLAKRNIYSSPVKCGPTASGAYLGLIVYPNPSIGILIIRDVSGSSIDHPVTVYNMVGEKLFQARTSQSLDISPYPNGMYILNIEMGNEVVRKKVVLNR